MATSYQYVCSSCGYIGYPKKVTKGNFLMEVILWLAFLLPGLLYSLWRITNKKRVCPKCQQETMIPANTPKGQELSKKYHSESESQRKKCPFCAEEVQSEAIKCKHCGSSLPIIQEEKIEKEANEPVELAQQEKNAAVEHDKKVYTVLGLIALAVLTPALWFLTIPAVLIWVIWKKTAYSQKIKALLAGVILVIIGIIYVVSIDEVPVVTITEPTENLSVQSASVTVKGKVQPNTAGIRINNAHVKTNNGEFSHEVKLEEGKNTITVVAVNGSQKISKKILIERVLTEEEVAEKQQQQEEELKKEVEEKQVADNTQNTVSSDPIKRIEEIIHKEYPDSEVTVWSGDNFGNADNAPWEVVINSPMGSVTSCSIAKNMVYYSLKSLYTDELVREKISRVLVNATPQVSASLGGSDGLSISEELWQSNDPTNTMKALQETNSSVTYWDPLGDESCQ